MQSVPNDYDVKVIYINRSKLWEKNDQDIISKSNFDYIKINLFQEPFLNWLKASLIEKFSRMLYPCFKKNLKIIAFASNKSSVMLFNYIKRENFGSYNYVFGFSSG